MKIPYKNIEIHYTKTGTGPAIVWLHGFMGNKEIWRRLTNCFDSNFTNICIDLLGHGSTNCLSEIHTMEEQADMVFLVLETLGITKFSLIGHSMGGYIALALLEKKKDKISHFALLNSTSNPDSEEKKLNRERAIKIVATQKNSFVRMGVVNLFSKNSKKQFSEEIEQTIVEAQSISVQGIRAALKGMKIRLGRINILKGFQGEKMIISGKEDPVLSHLDLEQEANNTKSQLLSLESGHMSYLESFEELQKNLKVFLSQKRASEEALFKHLT